MNIRIDGVYDGVVNPTDADRRMMAKIDPEVEQRKKLVGFERLTRDPKPRDVIEQLLFTPHLQCCRQLHRVRRLLHRLPLRQHHVPSPRGGYGAQFKHG
ncbi:MAG TPA: hypothetical protein VIO37_10215 [Candidatus Dormibacteraeota bacterium]|jgi:hypothetical protein